MGCEGERSIELVKVKVVVMVGGSSCIECSGVHPDKVLRVGPDKFK